MHLSKFTKAANIAACLAFMKRIKGIFVYDETGKRTYVQAQA